MHPVLVPGAHVLRRDSAEFQVGLGAGAVTLPGASPPDVTRLGSSPALTPLVRAGLAASDDRVLRRTLPAPTDDPWLRHSLAAVARRTGERLAAVLPDRKAHVVDVVPFGNPLGRHLAADLLQLCDRTGLRVAARPTRRGSGEPPSVRALVGVGEPSRDLLDPLLRAGLPHLLVRLTEGRALVGPFVLPGRSACVRCIDAYRREEDPSWPLLVEQYARATCTDRADGIPEPVDAALATVALGWAARELATYAEGSDPSTLSVTVGLSPMLDTVERHSWRPHPHCGCAW